MSNVAVTIHKNVDISIPVDIEQEQAITLNEFSSILASAIRRAWMLAYSLGHGQVLVEHFITALFAEEGSRKILERHGYSDNDGEAGQELTKKRSGFGAPTFDPLAVSPGKLLKSPHLDAWFRAARHLASTREVEHVTLVVDDFMRALEPNALSGDKELAAEIAESLEFVRGKLHRQGHAKAQPFKTRVIFKLDEVLTELRGEVNAANAARTKAMELLTGGLKQLQFRVDELYPSISVVKSEIDAANAARSAELHQLEDKIEAIKPSISAAVKSEVDSNISAIRTEVQKGAEKLSVIEHYMAVGQNNLAVQIMSLQETLAHAHDITHSQLSALANELARERRFGRILAGLLPVMAIAAGIGIGVIARMTFGPL